MDSAAARRFDFYSHVKLPDDMERARMITTLLIPCVLSETEVSSLVSLSKNNSFHEIKKFIGHVERSKWHIALRSTAFLKSKNGTYTACSHDTPGAVVMTAEELPENSLRGEPITFKDLEPIFRLPSSASGTGSITEINDFKRKYEL